MSNHTTKLKTYLHAKRAELRAKGCSEFEIRSALHSYNGEYAEEHGIEPADDDAVDRMADPEPIKPVLAPDDDGLAAGLEMVGWEVGWNVTAGLPACRRLPDEAGEREWLPALDGEHRDEMLLAVQKAANIQVGNREYPYRLGGRRAEDRVINVLARRHPFDGKPSDTYEKAHLILADHPGQCRMLTWEMYALVSVENYHQNPIQLGTRDKADIRRAATDLGWAHRFERKLGVHGPRWWWCTPGPPRAVKLLSFLR